MAELNGRIPDAHLALLKELGTDTSPHSGRSLLDHLLGTFALLQQWGNVEDVCVAGLFHSIYGTAYYRVESASLDRRDDVAAAIGERAEQLAFLFCVTDRPAFFDQASVDSPVLHNRVADAPIQVDVATIDDLIEIEAANVVEQLDPARAAASAAGVQRMLDLGAGHMSPAARDALSSLLGSSQGTP